MNQEIVKKINNSKYNNLYLNLNVVEIELDPKIIPD
jgi:hypothetical protein